MNEHQAIEIAIAELNIILETVEYGTPRYNEINNVCNCLIKLLAKIDH